MHIKKNDHQQIYPFLSKQECIDMINDVIEWKGGKVVRDDADGELDESIRVVEQSSVMRDYLDWKSFILKRMQSYHDELGIEILPDFYILKYTKGSKYDPHVDRGKFYEDRQKTIVIQLSDESDYEGGSLIVGDGGWETTKEQGALITFDSGKTHWVSELLSGTRYAIVMWITDSNMKKTLL